MLQGILKLGLPLLGFIPPSMVTTTAIAVANRAFEGDTELENGLRH
jgi:hypothetical protein